MWGLQLRVDCPEIKSHSVNFLNALALNGLSNIVNVPTHSCGHTLDLVLVPGFIDGKNVVENMSVCLVDPLISDHCQISFDINLVTRSKMLKTVKYLDYSASNTDHFGRYVAEAFFLQAFYFFPSVTSMSNLFFTSLLLGTSVWTSLKDWFVSTTDRLRFLHYSMK